MGFRHNALAAFRQLELDQRSAQAAAEQARRERDARLIRQMMNERLKIRAEIDHWRMDEARVLVKFDGLEFGLGRDESTLVLQNVDGVLVNEVVESPADVGRVLARMDNPRGTAAGATSALTTGARGHS